MFGKSNYGAKNIYKQIVRYLKSIVDEWCLSFLTPLINHDICNKIHNSLFTFIRIKIADSKLSSNLVQAHPFPLQNLRIYNRLIS